MKNCSSVSQPKYLWTSKRMIGQRNDGCLTAHQFDAVKAILSDFLVYSHPGPIGSSLLVALS